MNDIDVPRIEEDEVLVAIRSVGICRMDIDLLGARYIVPLPYLIIHGRMWSGEIVEGGRSSRPRAATVSSVNASSAWSRSA